MWLALLLTVASPAAVAASIEVREAALRPVDDSYVLSAEFAVELGPRLEDAVTRGVPLYFTLELLLERPRQYWVAEHIATRVQSYKLSYNSLTRQYRLVSGALFQNFAALDEALRAMSRVVSLPVVDRAALKPGETYQAALRLSLDRSQLPKPFQIDAITDREWVVDARTRRWSFQVMETK